MPTDPVQTGLAATLLGLVVAFARKAVKVSSLELRVVDPKNEAQVTQLRTELDATKEQLNSTRVELATVRAELLALQSMRSAFDDERRAWQDERARLREHAFELERRLDTRPDPVEGLGALDIDL